mmetsp:Transcript_14231/g.40330  ORF Transcript_14231/g.40330 Transcript_14231/m.40330 type:complete len:466 (-) Transcript_14231:235-1632(-)|eukprot:CAMPEP_0117685054 /NCGR_PEP_ID=MMETSP0804-20121206/21510_1 /TAXON_ID=1074897 /ORGANISM="Tetraselmis astigmatica, Strain CCMP880" /LENGTH=465 /DNA_ID=CAMNT_0005496251 /DNA_START=43 /DNA_END=1440 /DNA_ORIENTATION=+
MAWTVSNNAWADRVDGEEEAPPPPPVLAGGTAAFPSLGDAAAMPQPTKKEKKKGGKPAKMTLADFNSGTYKPPAQASSTYSSSRRRGEVRDEDLLNMLPKGPAGYDPAEQGGNRLGGAFKTYGGDRGGGYGDRDQGPRRGFGDREERDEEREDEGPSRADMDDDWGASRKFVPNNGPSRGGGGGGHDRERRDGYDREDDRPPREDMGPSRADESDNWGRDRKPLPAPEPRGGGYGDRGGSKGFSDYGPDRGSMRDSMGPSKADTEDSWGRRAPTQSDDRARPSEPSKADTENRWSRRGPPTADTPSQAPAGERPRLKLAPRTKPIENPPPPKAEATPAPVPAEPRAPKPNPFGTARPREEILKEQGKDPVKEDMKLEAAGYIREDTAEELKLKEELEELKKKSEGGEDLKEAIAVKESDIESLRLAVNDKLRFAQKKADEAKTNPAGESNGTPEGQRDDTSAAAE